MAGEDGVCSAFPLWDEVLANHSAWQAYSVVAILALLVAWSLQYVWNEILYGSYYCKVWWEHYVIPIPNIELKDLPSAVTEDDGVTTKPSTTKPLLQDPNHPGFIQCYDPSTQQYLGQVPAMTKEDVHNVCVKAAAAQKQWQQTSFAQRRQVLRTLQKYICQHVKEICRVSARDSGKPFVDACLGEVLTTTEKIRTIVAEGELWLWPSYRHTGPMLMHKSARVEYVPLGIIAPIAPWNYPFHNFMNHIISGIFAGNAVVGKVSEHTSWSAVTYYSQMVRASLEINGHNPDLCGLITGFGEAGAALVSDPLVDKVIFTGSPSIGKKVMEAASHHLKPVILELGGKDAMVITEECTITEIVPWMMRGCFQNGGQNCVGVERVLVYESIHDDLVQAILPKVKALRQGPPCGGGGDYDCGSMVMEAQLDHVQELVDDAVAQGANLLAGGKRNADWPQGQFYEPTLLTGVTPNMRIFQEEVFGPVMTVVQVPKDSDDQCLKMVNNSNFGLGASVYCGNNTARGLAIGRQIRSGMCCINDFGSNYLVQSLPFGGVKESGFGRFAGIEGLRALCLERSILTDRIPGVKTSIPSPIDYPIDKKKGLPFVDSLIQLFYNESMVEKVKAIVGLIKYG